jgi:hypothetical protein
VDGFWILRARPVFMPGALELLVEEVEDVMLLSRNN